MKWLTAPIFVNCEITSRCNKSCVWCGRRKIDKDYPEIKMNYGDMDFNLVKSIAEQLPENIVVAFHWNGEATLYPRFGKAVKLFKNQIKVLDTNGKLIVEKADEIIDNLDTLTISVIENDPEGDEQYEIVKKFLEIKGDRKPRMIYRLLGDVGKLPQLDKEYGTFCDAIKNINKVIDRKLRWYALPGIVATRTLHNPLGSRDYQKKVTVPEIGFCIEMLSHLAIDRFGRVSQCVRFDPKGEGTLGDLNKESLFDIWNSEERLRRLKLHVEGKRNEIPVCKDCSYYGCPVA